MRKRKQVNAAFPQPLVQGEYVSMLRDYERDRKRQRIKQELDSKDVSSSPEPTQLPKTESIDSDPVAPERPDLQSDSDMDSDEFEDVDLDNGEQQQQEQYDGETAGADLLLSIDESKAKHLTKKSKEKSLSKVSRLTIHKLSLMAWMYHAKERNSMLLRPAVLNNSDLSKLVPHSIREELFPPDHLTPFLKSKQFIEGIRHTMEIWQLKFQGLRPGLASVPNVDAGDPTDVMQYAAELRSRTGSADMVGQGFVALLRSLGLNVRLICSLQPPDNLGADTAKRTAAPKEKSSDCPIFWAEVWDEYVEKWIAVDPMTSTVRLPTRNRVKLKLEPTQSDRFNVMRYVIAFDSKNAARDVTRRYSSSYNARTRKKRLPHFESEEWLDTFMARFCTRNYTQYDRDEIAELARYPRLEGIPTRVQDFVGHPEYALATQLRHDEVLKPGAKPCGILSLKTKVASKSQAGPNYIYSRQDVLNVRSAQSWYKRGFSIRLGAQPRGRRDRKNRLTGETENVGLYSEDQTELYIPEPIQADGKVPKTQYKTIDIFAKWMIPKGGAYIKSKYGTEAAKILCVDYANVVTGVDFGRGGPKSRMLGVVVAKQYAAAVEAVIGGLRDLEAEDLQRREDLRILLLWRKFIMGVQIWERVEKMNPSSLAPAHEAEPEAAVIEDDEDDKDSEDSQTAGANHATPKGAHAERGKPETATDEVEDESSDIEIIETRQENTPMQQNKKIFYVNPAKAFSRLRELYAESAAGISLNRAQKSASPPPKFKESPESPDSYHSVSDLDVDEISESEL